MKYSQIRKENKLKEIRYYILNQLKNLELLDEKVFKTYGSMIVKMYELNYYDKYEDLLDPLEEKALTEVTEILIELIDSMDDEYGISINSNTEDLIKSITTICIEKKYEELAVSLHELIEMI